MRIIKNTLKEEEHNLSFPYEEVNNGELANLCILI